MSDPYVYPGTAVLRNKLGTRDPIQLERVEKEFVTQRLRKGAPTGNFDLNHLQAIHKYLFQDVYEWAGEVRTVEINKDGNQFQFAEFIEIGMGNVHQRVVQANYLRGLSPSAFARDAAKIIGDVNYVHPFREGNGRTQMQYLKQLAARAEHALDLARVDPAQWIEASKEAHQVRYDDMAQAIRSSIVGREKAVRDQGRER